MTEDDIGRPLTAAQQHARDMLTLAYPGRFVMHESFGRPGLYYAFDLVKLVHQPVPPDVDVVKLLEKIQ